jgi:hypothetical protein
MWHEYDKGGKWMIKSQGNAILYLGGLRKIVRWRAVQSELVQPGQLPDGLLEVVFEDQPKPVHVIVELATKAERRLVRQLLRDLLLVYLDREEVPEVITIIFRRTGRYRVPTEAELKSRCGLSKLKVSWRVVETWTLTAEELLAANLVGLIPLVPFTHYDGPPEQLLQKCRERIEQQAAPDERANLLAITQIMAQLAYNNSALLTILGGSQVMLESPLIQELMTKNTAQTTQKNILQVLETRLGPVPQDIATALQAIQEASKLDKLMKLSAACPDLETFHSRLRSIARKRNKPGRRQKRNRKGPS